MEHRLILHDSLKNFDIWINSLKNCGISPKKVLEIDKKIERSKNFSVTEGLVYEQKLKNRKLRQQFNDIFEVLDDFQSSDRRHNVKLKGYRTLLVTPFLKMESYEEIFYLLRRALFNSIHVDSGYQNLGVQYILADPELFAGAYHANFFLGHTHSYESLTNAQVYKLLQRELEILAAIASGDYNLERLEWELDYRCLALMKATAGLYLEQTCRFPPWDYDQRYEHEVNDMKLNIPGSWPEDQS